MMMSDMRMRMGMRMRKKKRKRQDLCAVDLAKRAVFDYSFHFVLSGLSPRRKPPGNPIKVLYIAHFACTIEHNS
jgi:hypothetical protein